MPDSELEHLDDLMHRFHQQLVRPAVPADVKQYGYERVHGVRAKLQRVQRPGGYEDFVLSYVQRERERFKAGERGRVCACDDSSCPIKKGELPKELQDADHIDVGIRQFKLTHRGRPIVLDDAQREWGELVSDVELVLREALTVIANEQVPEGWTPGPGLAVIPPESHDDNDDDGEQDAATADGATA